MTTPLEAAQQRLNNAAIVVGSCLLDGPDPSYGDQVELEAACAAYAEALRREADALELMPLDLSLKAALIHLDAGWF